MSLVGAGTMRSTSASLPSDSCCERQSSDSPLQWMWSIGVSVVAVSKVSFLRRWSSSLHAYVCRTVSPWIRSMSACLSLSSVIEMPREGLGRRPKKPEISVENKTEEIDENTQIMKCPCAYFNTLCVIIQTLYSVQPLSSEHWFTTGVMHVCPPLAMALSPGGIYRERNFTSCRDKVYIPLHINTLSIFPHFPVKPVTLDHGFWNA